MFSVNLNENKIIWLALLGSICLHALIFIFSGKGFIPKASFSLQPSMQSVEISIEEINETPVSQKIFSTVGENKNIVHERAISPKQKPVSSNAITNTTHAGLKVRASPDYYQNPSPEYPELAKQMHQEGLVLLSVDVNAQGLPVSVEIKQSCGHRPLDEAALKAVWKWKFEPGQIGGMAVESSIVVPIRFELVQQE